MKHFRSLPNAILVAALVHGSSAWGQCSNDAGAGDTAETEGCNLNEDIDTTNGGCNSSPPVFTDVAADGGLPRTYCSTAANFNNTTTCVIDEDCPDGNCDEGTGLCIGASGALPAAVTQPPGHHARVGGEDGGPLRYLLVPR